MPLITRLISNVRHCKPQIYLYFLHLHKKSISTAIHEYSSKWENTLILNPDHKQKHAYMSSKPLNIKYRLRKELKIPQGCNCRTVMRKNTLIF